MRSRVVPLQGTTYVATPGAVRISPSFVTLLNKAKAFSDAVYENDSPDPKLTMQVTPQASEQFGAVAPGLVEYTTDYLFRDLWLRPDLAPRDRSLITVAALIASGQVAQITFHLNRAMDSGLTQEEAGEVITHLAFYAGWPNAFSAVPVAKDVFDKRPR